MRCSILIAALSAGVVSAASSSVSATASASSSAASAGTTWVVTVGGNTTTNGSLVYSPQRVVAAVGDTVLFNFTKGNHTVTQSTFASPCIPAHLTDPTVNGFDSAFRNAGPNSTAVTILTVPILPGNVNNTMWFYDYNTCAIGGVGVINSNETSNQTLLGFVRNAERLNGTLGANSTNSSGTSGSSGGNSAGNTGGGGSGSTGSSDSSDATRTLTLGATIIIPMLLAALSL